MILQSRIGKGKKNNDKQKKYYSGKPKSHRFKNQIVITEKAEEIIDVIVGKRGREGDIKLFKKTQKSWIENKFFKEIRAIKVVKKSTSKTKKNKL